MMSPHRARFIGTRHMIAAGHYLATQAGFQILEAGGNAIDAGVTAGIALGVVQSEYVGFAGVAPIMIHLAESGRTITISGLGTWPARTDPDLFLREYGGRIPTGVLRSIVPAAPDAWITALELFGTMSFGDCAAAALRFAREGFPVPSLMSAIIADHADEYSAYPGNAAIYLPGGKPPGTGDILVQADLGSAIAYMIDEERAAAPRGREAGLNAARDAFYRGDIARRIAAHQREEGGWLDESDLAGFRVEVEDAKVVRFRNSEIFTCGPWCQGPVLGQTLAMLDGVDLSALGHNSPAYIHHLTEVLKLAYADRHALYGDPNFVDVPIDRLLSSDYAKNSCGPRGPRSRASRNARARTDVGWGIGSGPDAETRRDPGELDTSYVCVVDRAGNAFSATPSDGSASGPVVPGLGFVVSGRGTQSFTEPAAPARVGPGAQAAPDPQPGLCPQQGRRVDDAVRLTRKRRSAAGDAAGLPQHACVRDEPAGRHRCAALRDVQLSPVVLSPRVFARPVARRGAHGRRRQGARSTVSATASWHGRTGTLPRAAFARSCDREMGEWKAVPTRAAQQRLLDGDRFCSTRTPAADRLTEIAASTEHRGLSIVDEAHGASR